MSDRVKVALALMVALAQGLLYLLLLPPWQHYDEPTHFEYAWLIANRGRLPVWGDVDTTMRREVAASMLEHNFYSSLPRPNVITNGEISIGISELGHPPAYYAFVSLPLALIRHLDVTNQLYVARFVSLVLFLLTIMVVAGVVRELTPRGHMLRWAIPLAAALMPPVVDVMTAVNNDVGAIFVFSLFLWGAVRTIRFGLTWTRLLWLLGSALLAVRTKNTAAMAIVLVPFVFLLAFWLWRSWRWRWLTLGMAAMALVLGGAVLGWGDAAYWYRSEYGAVQESATRITDSKVSNGSHAIMLENMPNNPYHYLISPILREHMSRIAGRTITVGGWVWADQPATVGGPGLMLSGPDIPLLQPVTHPITVTTAPTFTAWTFTVPPATEEIHYALFGNAVQAGERPIRIMLNGAFVVVGAFPTDIPPVFDDASGRTGTWGNQRFTNLVRDPSGTAAWPRFRPWFQRTLARYLGRSPAPVLAALCDVERTWRFLLQVSTQVVLPGFFTGFAWGHVKLTEAGWPLFFDALMLIGLVGCVGWLVRPVNGSDRTMRPALVFLGLSGLLLWGNTVIRPLPMLDTTVSPTTRYAFPALVPTVLALAGGWWALWPRRFRVFGSVALLLLLFGLNALSVYTIWSFYRSLPVS